MKKILPFLILVIQLLSFPKAYTQILNIQSAVLRTNQPSSFYSGDRNFLGKDVFDYIGQDLCFIGDKHSDRSPVFYKDYIGNTFTLHWANNSNGVNYEIYTQDYLKGKTERERVKYFHVIDVLNHPQAGRNTAESKNIYDFIFFLKVSDRDDREEYYFRYDSRFPQDFPFIVFTYYVTQKQKIVGSLLNEKDIDLQFMYDVKSGKPIKQGKNKLWECTDLSIEVNDFQLVAQYQRGNESILIPYTWLSKKIDVDKSIDYNNQMDITSITDVTTIYPKIVINENKESSYDPSLNFLGINPYPYIGQEIFIKPIQDSQQQFGYDDFYNKKGSSKDKLSLGKTYAPLDIYLSYSRYESLVGKYFRVVNVFAHPDQTKQSAKQDAKHMYYLELEASDSGEHLYYEYQGDMKPSRLPFITLQHLDYLKDRYLGEQIILGNYNWWSRYEDMKLYDMNSGENIVDVLDKKWTCIDVNFVDTRLAFILQSEQRDVIAIPHESLFSMDEGLKHFKTLDELRKEEEELDGNKLDDGTLNVEYLKEKLKLKQTKGTPKLVKKSMDGQIEKWEYYHINGKEIETVMYIQNNIVVATESAPSKR